MEQSMVADAPKHPAKYSPEILAVMHGWVTMEAFWLDKPLRKLRILDPFAGTGLVHQLPGKTFGIELEPEWAALHHGTRVGSALDLPWRKNSFDVIATSPCYGNRFSDHHNAKDGSRRRSYTHDLGRPLHPDNAGALPWGLGYRRFHLAAWGEAVRVLRTGGLFLLNISDFVRGGERMPVSRFHYDALQSLGMTAFARRDIDTKRLRHGSNREARVECEHLVAFRKTVVWDAPE